MTTCMRRRLSFVFALALIGAVGPILWVTCSGHDRASPGDSGRASLNLYTVPPDAPPAVDIGRADGSGRMIRGSLYRAEWLVGNKIEPVVETENVPWGGSQLVPTADNLAVFIHSRVRPRNVTVNVFADAVDDAGEPTGDPVTTLDCWLEDLDSGPCRLTLGDTGEQILRMPTLPAGDDVRISVFASWPELRVADRTALSVNSASWVFHLDVSEVDR